MKKQLILCLALVALVFAGFAQITIKSADMPSSGDTLRFSNVNPTQIDSIENTGVNYFWDYSHLKAISQEVTEFRAASKTPYAFYFIGGNKFGVKIADSISLGVVSLYDLYDFYQNSSSAFVTEGRGLKYSGFPIGSYYSDKDEIYQFPLDYNDRDSSTFKYKMELATLVSYISTGYRINEVDGWGKIKTPYGTFNCLRVKSTINNIDTIKFSGFPFGYPGKTIEYKWLAKGEKLPILEVIVNDGAAGSNITSVKFRDIYRKTYNPNAPVANFEADNTNPTTVDPVLFTNQTTNPGMAPSYNWVFQPNSVEFQDGTDAGSRDPKIIFKKAGKYTVKLTVANLFGSTHDTTFKDYINVIDAKTLAPKSDFIADKTTAPINGWIFITNQTKNKDNCTFEWTFFPDKVTYLNGTDKNSMDPIIALTEGGYYNVSLKSKNKYGEHDTTKMNFFSVSGTTSINDQATSFNIYPNPVQEVLKINFVTSEERTLKIVSSTGQIVYHEITTEGLNYEIDLSSLTKGIYVFEVISENKIEKGVFLKE